MFFRDSHSQKLQQRQEEMRQVREEIERRQEENYTQKEHNNGNLIFKNVFFVIKPVLHDWCNKEGMKCFI